ncbi:MAG: ABC transporter ATP-binding protein [Actinobacteria bacterium]|nr:ABC transporter ATP-binding protein [Actinomycetota bacterium]
MLSVNGIETFYGSVQALYGVSLKVGQGEIVSLIGSNGAGKTTTLRTICGLIRPAKGSIEFKGQRIDRLPPASIVRMKIAHCPEGRQLWPRMTVLENLEMGAFTRQDQDGVARDLAEVMKMFPILAQRQGQLAESLSGGEQQALAVARALMSQPELIIFDEPSLGLAPKLVADILNMIKRLQTERGITVLLVEQNAYAALKIADRAYVLEKGRVVLEGPAGQIAGDPYVKKAYLGM